MGNTNKEIIKKYMNEYAIGNLTIINGGHFEDFLNRLIKYYEDNEAV